MTTKADNMNNFREGTMSDGPLYHMVAAGAKERHALAAACANDATREEALRVLVAAAEAFARVGAWSSADWIAMDLYERGAALAARARVDAERAIDLGDAVRGGEGLAALRSRLDGGAAIERDFMRLSVERLKRIAP